MRALFTYEAGKTGGEFVRLRLEFSLRGCFSWLRAALGF
ncbi:hypothetical protein SAMN05428997_12960 [Bosea sp. CRIB-10]|jgi:hypothetical protein|nr:hypothetical protein SAMN05428997_12960 [Bosea sp. CRIB-10]